MKVVSLTAPAAVKMVTRYFCGKDNWPLTHHHPFTNGSAGIANPKIPVHCFWICSDEATDVPFCTMASRNHARKASPLEKPCGNILARIAIQAGSGEKTVLVELAANKTKLVSAKIINSGLQFSFKEVKETGEHTVRELRTGTRRNRKPCPPSIESRAES